jgi:hypothetical protein
MGGKCRSGSHARLKAALLLVLVLAALAPSALGQDSGNVFIPRMPAIPEQNNTVHIGVHLIDLYNFEYQTGHYTYDMYVYFFWTDPAIETANWYFMNGYPTYPGAKLLVREGRNGSVKWEMYRVRADFTSPIEPTNYPFDRITLPISIELLSGMPGTTLVWLDKETGIGSGFTNVGWTRPVYDLRTSVSHYPLGIDSPRVDMIIVMDRYPFGAFIKTIFPPLIFCFVAAVCFLFRMHETAALSLRTGIMTSMLVSAVLFVFAEQSSIPTVSGPTLFHDYMIAVILFLALGLIVTVVGYTEWMRTNDAAYTDRLNRAGFAISLVLPLLLFMVLVLFR